MTKRDNRRPIEHVAAPVHVSEVQPADIDRATTDPYRIAELRMRERAIKKVAGISPEWRKRIAYAMSTHHKGSYPDMVTCPDCTRFVKEVLRAGVHSGAIVE